MTKPLSLNLNDAQPNQRTPPVQQPNTKSLDHDTRDVLRVHQQWWKANVGLDMEAMKGCFPSGDAFSMFNRNGFTYFGVDELTKLWEHYSQGPPRLIQTVAIVRLEVSSDIAWLICELKYRRVSPVTSDDHWEPANVDEVFGSKATEIYHRDDGNGRPEWRMWHFQSGALHPANENRPAFDDSDQTSQLGYNPYGPPLTYTYTLEGYAGQASLEEGIPSPDKEVPST